MKFTSTTEIFEFWEHKKAFRIVRCEIQDAYFAALRRSLSRVIFALHDSEDEEVSRNLRALLSGWLTTPAPFENCSQFIRSAIGSEELFHLQVDREIRNELDNSFKAADLLVRQGSRLRTELSASLQSLASSGGLVFRIFCHTRAKAYFCSLASEHGVGLSDAHFLHTLRHYREERPFDVLVKVGPLRSGGWGWAPDAILSAPRFHTLQQFAWEGSQDEEAFGYDPAILPDMHADALRPYATIDREQIFVGDLEETRVADEDASTLPVDELSQFRLLDKASDSRLAVLVAVDQDEGFLFTPHSGLLSVDPRSRPREPVRRTAGDTLTDGMYLIRPRVSEVDLGDIRAGHGQYSRQWKQQLRQMYGDDPEALIEKLRNVRVRHLPSAIARWSQDPSTVIHAPQRRKDFEALLSAIELDVLVESEALPFMALAWREIRLSRGVAIQAGFQEQEIVESELLAVLNQAEPRIAAGLLAGRRFSIDIPANIGLQGFIDFFPVLAVEPGFSAPSDELKERLPMAMIDRWRA